MGYNLTSFEFPCTGSIFMYSISYSFSLLFQLWYCTGILMQQSFRLFPVWYFCAALWPSRSVFIVLSLPCVRGLLFALCYSLPHLVCFAHDSLPYLCRSHCVAQFSSPFFRHHWFIIFFPCRFIVTVSIFQLLHCNFFSSVPSSLLTRRHSFIIYSSLRYIRNQFFVTIPSSPFFHCCLFQHIFLSRSNCHHLSVAFIHQRFLLIMFSSQFHVCHFLVNNSPPVFLHGRIVAGVYFQPFVHLNFSIAIFVAVFFFAVLLPLSPRRHILMGRSSLQIIVSPLRRPFFFTFSFVTYL